MGKTIIIHDDKKKIECEEYYNKGIDSVVIENGLKIIDRHAFAKNNLTKLIIPSSVTDIFSYAFFNNPINELTFYNNGLFIADNNFSLVTKINVIDGDYNFLKKFLLHDRIYTIDNFNKLKEIVIVNNKLSSHEKTMIKKLSYMNGIQISIVEELDLAKSNINDDEVKDLVKEIKKLCKSLDDDVANIIKSKVSKLLNEYENNLSNFKLDYTQKENTCLTLECTSPRDLQNNLIISLNNILILLNSNKKILNLSFKIKEYYNFITENKCLELKDDNNFNKISKIKELSSLFKNKSLINKLKHLLLETKEFINNSLRNIFNNKIDLNDIDINIYFNIELDKIYQQVMLALPYENLLKSLQFDADSNLANELISLNDVFTSIYNKIISELYDKYHKLIKKYIKFVKDNAAFLFEDKEYLSAVQIETNFRQELNPILEELNKEIFKIMENKDLLSDVSLTKKYMKDKVNENDNWLISIVKEILDLTNNCLLDDNFRNHINNKLKKLLKYWYKLLNNENLSNIIESNNKTYGLTSSILIVKTKIISDFYEIKSELESYLARLEEYDEYTNRVDKKKSDFNNSKKLERKNKYIYFWML